MNRTLLVLNGIVVLLVLLLVVALILRTGNVPLGQMFWLLPPLLTWLTFKRPGNRAIGGVAALVNCLFVLGGVLLILVGMMGSGRYPNPSYEYLGYLAGLYVVAVGMLNFREIWVAFPVRKSLHRL